MRRLAITLLLSGTLAATAVAATYPQTIPLPQGWQPEGIATGAGATFFVGSIPTGDIWRGDYRTGEGSPFIDAPDGRAAIGLDARSGRLFVAGGPTGDAYVYDTRTGAQLAAYDFATGAPESPTFVNDVIATGRYAYFTDSFRPVIYRAPVAGGEAEAIPVDVPYRDGFNLNGIVAVADGRWLIAVQSNTGQLWRIDPATGDATEIEVRGGALTAGDGLLLRGRRLWVVRNLVNEIVELRLGSRLEGARVRDTLSDPDLDVPTTLARHGSRLWAVNARFGTPEPAAASYDVVQVDR